MVKTSGSPIAIGTDGALNAVGGFDFTGDGKEDLLTIGFGPSGTSEVRINPGNGTGGFLSGGTASLGQVVVSVTEDNLAAGFLYPSEVLGDAPKPAVAAIAGGALRLFKAGIGQLGSLSEQTAPTFSGTTLRSVAIGDLDGDGRDDLVVTGRVTTPTTRGAVFVMLNGAGGLGAPVELSQPGSEAGKLALGDVNGDGRSDIVVCNPTDNCAKIYLATAPGIFGAAPVTIDTAGGSYGDTRPQAVAIGDLLPSTGKEMVFWNTCGDNGDPNRIIQFAIIKHTGGGIFEKDAGIGFSEHPAAGNRIGDIALGDFNGDGQFDIVGTDPVLQTGGLAVVPVKLDENGHFDFANSPMFEVATTETPDNIAVGNPNGDLFTGTNRPRSDVIITHLGTDANHTVDVFLNTESTTPPAPPGTPVITTSTWPQLGGELTATGGSGALRYTAIVNGRTTSELPSGQRLSSIGEVVGVAANGTHTITVRVTAGKKFSEKTFTFTVNNVAEPAQGILAWWPGEDAGADVVGGNTALALTEPAYAPGKVGRAFSFDGVDDFIYANDPSGVLNLNGNLTIEGWVKPTADSKGVRTIVAKHDSADEDLTFALQLEKNGDLSFVAQRAADRRPTIVTSLASVPVGEWTHVAVRVRGVEVTLFINGRVDMTKTVLPTFLPPSTVGQAVTIGATCTSPTGARANFFKGEIDELTLYRRPLSDLEVDLVAKVGTAGKFRYDAASEFATTAPQPANALWRYGSMPSGSVSPANFTAFPTIDTTGPALDVWQTGTAGQAEVRRNRLTTTHSVGTGTSEIRYAPGQLAQKRGSDGTRSVVRWTAPTGGRYAVAVTWKCIDAHATAAGVLVQHNSFNMVSPMSGPTTFLGNGFSQTFTITAAASDTVDFIVSQNFADNNDAVSLFASVVELPEEYVPLKAPTVDDLDNDAPLQTGKQWSFRARQEDSPDHEGRMVVKLQYSATPNVPGSWVDVPGGGFSRVSSLGWRLNISTLPVGSYAFRIATSVTGQSTTFSDPTQVFNIGAATTILDFISREQVVASDPTGATTHRGDLITYRFVVRNAGGLAARGVSLRAIIPDGTKVVSKTKGGKLRTKPGIFGFPPLSYMVWSLGDFEPTPLDDAQVFELTVKVTEPTVKQDSLNTPGTLIKQNDYALITGDFSDPDQIVPGPMPFLSATVTVPLSVTAVADDLTPDQGGTTTFTITVKNQSSYLAKKVQVEAALPEGMFLPVEGDVMQFLDAGGAPSGPPIDPATKKQAKFAKGLNPQRDNDSRTDGKMVAKFYIGSLPAGAQQKVRVRGQVQYGYYNRLVGNVPTIRAEDLSASWTSTAARIVTAKAAPVDFSVDVVPTAARPALGFAMSQIGADEVVKPGTVASNSQRVVAVTTKGYPVVASLPKRDSNIIHYTTTISNTGGRAANFVNANLSIPEKTSYDKGSLRLNGVAVKPVEGEAFGVKLISFTLPPLAANGSAHVVEYDVVVDRNAAIGDTIEQGGGFLTSRDIYYILGLQLALTSLKAEVVQPAVMDYYAYGQDVPATGNEVKQFISYTNKGGLAAEGVNIEYTIPPGLTFVSANYIDLSPVTAAVANKRTIEAPDVGQRGIVRFKAGTVEPQRIVKGKPQGGGGFVRVVCAVDAANIPQADAGENAWSLEHLVRGYEVSPSAGAPERTRGTGEIRPGDIRYAFRTLAQRQPANQGPLARTFVAMLAPASMLADDELQYTVIWGNVSNFSGGSGGMRVPIPDGTEYVAGSLTDGISTTGNSNFSADGNYNPPGDVPGLPPNGSITWVGGMAANSANIATFRVRLKPGFNGPVVASGGRSGFDLSGYRYLRDITTTVRSSGESIEAQQAQIFHNAIGEASAYVAGAANSASFLNATQKIGIQSMSITVDGADHFKVESNGVLIIPLLGGQMVAAGGGNLIGNDGSTLVAAGGGNLVAAGGGNLVKVDVGGGLITGTALYSQIPSLVAAGGLNLVNGGSGSLLEKRSALVGNDGASLVGNDGASLIGLDGSTLGQFRLIGNDGSTFFPANGGAGIALPRVGADMVAAGGGNLVAAGGGNLVAAGGLNLIGNDGSTLVAAGGMNLIGNDGSTLVAAGGLNLIGNDGSTLVAAGGGNLGAQANGRMVAAGGGNIVSGSNGVRPPGQ